MMRPSGSLPVIFVACCLFSVILLFAQEWQEFSGEHFIVYFSEDKDFAQQVEYKAEAYYSNIATDIGYPRYSEFWTWEKRVKIYLYPDHASFLKAANQPEWSHGMADYGNKLIFGYIGSPNFVESILPHEMAHLIFRDFVGFKGEVPLWLDEGVAQWAEEPKRSQIKAVAKRYWDNNTFLSIEDMMRLDIRNIVLKDGIYIRSTRTKEGKDGVLFLSADSLISTYYIQSVSLVGFLIEKYGSESFAHFCRELRDGKPIEEALNFAYPNYIHSLREFEDRWREYLMQL